MLSAAVASPRPSDDAELYRQLAPALVRFAMGLVGRDQAPDVVAEAFVRAMAAPGWGRRVENPRAYLYRAVFNQSMEHHRRTRNDRLKTLRSAVPQVESPADPRPEVLPAVMALSVQQRAAVILHYWEDLGVAEVAERMGISEGSVKQHLRRAREALREVLDE